jgi:hypothetical protein
MRFDPLTRNRRIDSSLTRRRRYCGEWKEEAPNSNLWGFSGFLRGAQGTYGGQGAARQIALHGTLGRNLTDAPDCGKRTGSRV